MPVDFPQHNSDKTNESVRIVRKAFQQEFVNFNINNFYKFTEVEEVFAQSAFPCSSFLPFPK